MSLWHLILFVVWSWPGAVEATAVITSSAAGCRAENGKRSDRTYALLQICCFSGLALLFPHFPTELCVVIPEKMGSSWNVC